MKAFLLPFLMFATPAAAERLTYSQCIATLNSVLTSKDAIEQNLSQQAQSFADASNPAPVTSAMHEAVRARDTTEAAFKAYVDALADACQSLR